MEEEKEEGAPAWLTTFADLMSLLLTFFILLLSFAEMNQKKFDSIIQSINIAFKGNIGPEGDTALNSVEKYYLEDKAYTPSGKNRKNLKSLYMSQIQDIIQNDLASQKLSWIETANGWKITMPADFTFAPESTKIKEGAKVLLRKIIRKTRNLKFGLIVRTHTDDRQVTNPLFESNWDFSLKRSTEVVRFILNESNAPSSWARAIGCAQGIPVAPNSSKKNRAINRRIEIEYEIEGKKYEVHSSEKSSDTKLTNKAEANKQIPLIKEFSMPKQFK